MEYSTHEVSDIILPTAGKTSMPAVLTRPQEAAKTVDTKSMKISFLFTINTLHIQFSKGEAST